MIPRNILKLTIFHTLWGFILLIILAIIEYNQPFDLIFPNLKELVFFFMLITVIPLIIIKPAFNPNDKKSGMQKMLLLRGLRLLAYLILSLIFIYTIPKEHHKTLAISVLLLFITHNTLELLLVKIYKI